ncbi:hypothetical protein A2W24_04945 [Microgenomates group bacterium RBG_16_45_19]|nr:MAG: hypothetical protein A2W24_04945 [Microgenomates group bacterium RBG_16_45_19]
MTEHHLTHFGAREGVALSALIIALVALPLGNWAAAQVSEARFLANQAALLAGLMPAGETGMLTVTTPPLAVATPALPLLPTARPTLAVVAIPQALPTAQNQFTLITTKLEPAVVGQPYTAMIRVRTPQPGLTPTLMTGRLPHGLTSQGCLETVQVANDNLEHVCVISGTPLYAGTFNFTVAIFDNQGNTVQTKYTLVVNP